MIFRVKRCCYIYSLLILTLLSCVSKNRVAKEYVENLKRDDKTYTEAKETFVFFLFDGLSVQLTQKLISENHIPNIKNFFLPYASQFFVGRATFPSLTHPNISSIITSSNIDKHPILGNKIKLSDDIVDFTLPKNQKKLNELIKNPSIFTELSSQKRRSLSIAPYYGDQATARYPLDLEMGLAYDKGDYRTVDSKLIDSLVSVLKNTRPESWPEFIFVHLVGLDGYEHASGEFSKDVINHAKFIDTKLGKVFELLKDAANKGRDVGALITADHGMQNVQKYFNIEAVVATKIKTSKFINEGRFLTLNFTDNYSQAEKQAWAQWSAALPGVEASVLNDNESLKIYSGNKSYTLRYQAADCGSESQYALSVENSEFLCPSKINLLTQKFFYPYFATNLASFFNAPQYPDLLVLAQTGAYFSSHRSVVGAHGGMTPEELFVPILTWNLIIHPSESITPTYKLLESLRAPRKPTNLH